VNTQRYEYTPESRGQSALSNLIPRHDVKPIETSYVFSSEPSEIRPYPRPFFRSKPCRTAITAAGRYGGGAGNRASPVPKISAAKSRSRPQVRPELKRTAGDGMITLASQSPTVPFSVTDHTQADVRAAERLPDGNDTARPVRSRRLRVQHERQDAGVRLGGGHRQTVRGRGEWPSTLGRACTSFRYDPREPAPGRRRLGHPVTKTVTTFSRTDRVTVGAGLG